MYIKHSCQIWKLYKVTCNDFILKGRWKGISYFFLIVASFQLIQILSSGWGKAPPLLVVVPSWKLRLTLRYTNFFPSIYRYKMAHPTVLVVHYSHLVYNINFFTLLFVPRPWVLHPMAGIYLFFLKGASISSFFILLVVELCHYI